MGNDSFNGQEKHYYLPYFWNSQTWLSSGHTWRVCSHRWMQWKWNAWLQLPHATVHSSLVEEFWLAWHSMPGEVVGVSVTVAAF